MSTAKKAVPTAIPYYLPRNVPVKDFLTRAEEVFAARWFSNFGVQEKQLAEKIAERHEVKECVLVANATLGLQLLMRALDLRGEVITPAFTFIATTHAIAGEGLTPVFCDIDPNTLTLDPRAVEAHISAETSAILAVHVYGQPCDVEGLTEVAQKHRLKLIFDAAHGFGVRRSGVSIGNFGLAEVLSFHATKLFQTFEGGAILTNDAILARRLRVMSNFGITGQDKVEFLGMNAKMHEISAACGLAYLPLVQEIIDRLAVLRGHYETWLEGTAGVTVFRPTAEVTPNHQYLPILVDEELFGATRDQLYEHLNQIGIGTRRYFFPGSHLQQPYQTWMPDAKAKLPVTSRVTQQILCLPCYFDLEVESVQRVCTAIVAYGDSCRQLLAAG